VSGLLSATVLKKEFEKEGSKDPRVWSLFVRLVANGWCWFVLREKYCWLVDDGWFVMREKYC
jgi:hypothetical protein